MPWGERTPGETRALARCQGRGGRVASGTSSFRQQICLCIHSLEWDGSEVGAGVHQGTPQPLPPLSPPSSAPYPLASATAGPQHSTGMLHFGVTAVAQPPGRGQGPAGLAGGWGGTPAPVQGARSRQLSTELGLSVLFLEGLLRDECPERIIPEACADAKTCGQGRECSANSTTIIKVLQGLCVNW